VFGAFYDRCKVGKTPGYPRFKPYCRFDQVRFVAGDGAKWTPAEAGGWARAHFQAVGSVKVKQHRTVSGTVKALQIKREHRRWYVIVTAQTGLGNRRRDFHHKTARALVESCDLIALEKLNTAGMSRRPAPKPDPVQPGGYLPNGAAAKSGLNKSILDAGWAQFASILAAKAEEAGRRVILVNPACTSIDCHACGARCTRPRQDTVICPHCGPHDADVNGARNIYPRAGLGSDQARAA
jgi:putative transposase